MIDTIISEEELEAEIEACRNLRLGILAEIGEKAIPELRDRPEFSESAAKLDDVAENLEALRLRAAKLQEEKALREKEERERLARCTCVICRTVNPDGAKFCEECGAKVGELPREYCRSCGTMNQSGMKFCGECGTKLDAAEAR